MYAPQGNETVSWNDPRLSTIELDFNGQVMTELLFDFSNSRSLVGISPDSMQATQKRKIESVQLKVSNNSAFTGIRLMDD